MIAKLKSLRDQILEKWGDLLERARTWWATLAPREKIILGSASGLFAAVLLVFFVKTFGALITETAQRAESLAENGNRIQTLIQQIVETRTQAERYDTLVLSTENSGELKDLIQSQATRYGVTVQESKAPATTSTLVSEDEEVLQVKLAPETSLSSALNFLEAMQNRLGVRVIQMKFVPNTLDRQKIEVEAMIAKRVFAKAEE